jgi:quercetin dioxygenase-like cupin family protein
VTPLELDSTFVVLQPDLSAVPVAVTPTIWQDLDERFERFKGRVLVSAFAFDEDWPTWERHPAGDEIVCLLSGRVTFFVDGQPAPFELKEKGSYLIVPKGTWHTAKTTVRTKMLFVTAGEGTENKPL